VKTKNRHEYLLHCFGSRDEMVKRLLEELKNNFILSSISEPDTDINIFNKKQQREIFKLLAREKTKLLLYLLGQ
jgi:hypothetical protein